jgi:hypothetical protein
MYNEFVQALLLPFRVRHVVAPFTFGRAIQLQS